MEPSSTARPPGAPVPGPGPSRWPLAAILLAALATRLAALPLSHEGNMSPDAAHFLNVARCITRGQGFSQPAAWPAWLRPERLPTPETFKDPGYPFAIAALTPVAGDPFRAGQAVSLAAGLLLVPVVVRLGLRITRDRAVAWLVGWLVAMSPVLIAQSVRVMSESLFTLLVTLAFLAGAPPAPPTTDRPRPARSDLMAGAVLGLAYLVRTQAALVLPALMLLRATGCHPREGLARAGRVLAATVIVASPLLARNLVLFGAPFHSDAATFAVWPFVDPTTFSHALERPPAPLTFLASHLPQLAGHVAHALLRFVRSALPRDLLGHPVWIPALAIGGALALARLRTWGFAVLFLVPLVLLMCAVSWNTRYFASTTPLVCLLAAVGAIWLARRLGAGGWPRAARVACVAALLVPGVLAARRAWNEVRGYVPEELAAAAAEAPWLAARLAHDEALIAETTSYWTWFADRASVHLPIAGEAEFMAVVRRYRVRWAALPTSRLAELAARYPEGRLPVALVRDHEDPARDVTVFAVRDPRDGTP